MTCKYIIFFLGQVNNTYSDCKTFFSLPPEIKSKYFIDMDAFHGYTPMNTDR